MTTASWLGLLSDRREHQREVRAAERQAVHEHRPALALLPALERECRVHRSPDAHRLAELDLRAVHGRAFAEDPVDRLRLRRVGDLEPGRVRPDRGDVARLHIGLLERKPDRKSTRLNSSHVKTSYAVFCLKKKT